MTYPESWKLQAQKMPAVCSRCPTKSDGTYFPYSWCDGLAYYTCLAGHHWVQTTRDAVTYGSWPANKGHAR